MSHDRRRHMTMATETPFCAQVFCLSVMCLLLCMPASLVIHVHPFMVIDRLPGQLGSVNASSFTVATDVMLGGGVTTCFCSNCCLLPW